ncbi:bifunctional alpha,alpha-trehalose-phosphate synthase (UDP-forming)/trehalose-phosphatase [Pyrobaculum aerophilum]|uniref:Alpha,alpha-trehalose-phosphate synthase n=1 Tax=Pyrobaculum aerophilum TaxID=13773 RepID=A0A371QV47_9CREN|nr:bifunctional alpha,alpha-trehalose-phosphate synthase (UDP-forming)/trehalose-phosphatase [Pyrobaculum aerophilum]RFA93940.1 bifunctional alpha,alpha-trehalose-phosphate synthase (UDP-forming)/trehalose-phosphatase [Pyrobaculum aerophilum]RFA98959.1 bifunctional alpha,alpha-trehalose-phosphate synthase (UDP-forming)/trehalose-phosphatase [Pyrobaculum aerophilum]
MRLIIVSNRLPVVLTVGERGMEIREAVGGLATAVKSFIKATENGKALGFSEVVWAGWSGIKAEQESEDLKSRLREMGLLPVSLTAEEVNFFYEGFCNSTLWPLFHGFTVYTVFESKYWEAYVKVNQKYAETVASVANTGDFVWIHDYHLMLMPAMLREMSPDVSIGFFLHIPFPPAEMYQLMPPPWRTALLDGVLASDLVGFHIHEYVNNFVRAVSKFLGYRTEAGVIYAGRRKVHVGAFPIGIDFDFFYNSSLDPEVAGQIEELRQKLRGLKIIFSIDRLDYTKGVINRVHAWERFLKEHPQWRGKASFILIVVPSRIGVPQYDAMKREIEREVGRINGELGDVNWTPIVYISRFIPTPTLLALYNIADVALITPLRDGMNLVSKEYVATKRDCKGVLILSETAGASHELLEALIVNPNDESGVVEAIAKALTMEPEEQCRRIKAMQEKLRQQNVVKWAVDFLHSLMLAYRENTESFTTSSKLLDREAIEEIVKIFHGARSRLLLLDYDGTLVPHYPYAYQAVPDGELKRLLNSLAFQPNTYVAVVSGRGRDFLEAWLGDLPIYIVAEHGAFIRDPGGNWSQLFPFDTSWKISVRKIMEEFTRLTPGSYIEEKEVSLAWHYRNVEPEIGEKAANRLADALTGLLESSPANIIRGVKVVEVRAAGVNKGAAAKLLYDKLRPELVIIAGDDYTDEEMMKALPEAITIKVGKGETSAKYMAPSYRRIRELLQALLTAQR